MMKRPSGSDSIRPLRAEVTDSTGSREVKTRTLRPLDGSLASPSKKNVRSPSPEVWNWPGATRERSERRLNWSFSSALCSFSHGHSGVYAFSPRAVTQIEPGVRLDFPDLVLRLLEAGETVRARRSENDYWLDIGRHDDYETAMDEFERMRDRFLPGQSQE